MNERVVIAPVRKTVRVKAPIDHAFEVFTTGLTRWASFAYHQSNRCPCQS